VVGLQNNTTAAINNLRRLGARRGQARDEARRIEAGLAGLLEKRGFRTLLNWVPPRDVEDAGEVDLIAALDAHLFVIEVKSTFMRRSQREAWLHATTTLRKAGQQLRRKAEAVSLAIASDPGFRTMFGWADGLIPTQQHVWIADTCIECDRQRFGGFLKVSVEELIIALRDDRHLLNDPGGLLAGNYGVDGAHEAGTRGSGWSLYPDGFSAERFVEVIETEAVWDLQAATRGPSPRSTDREDVVCRK
jgi:Holliday junction resolvase-like predicted endonuclease